MLISFTSIIATHFTFSSETEQSTQTLHMPVATDGIRAQLLLQVSTANYGGDNFACCFHHFPVANCDLRACTQN